jgi:hypothetical protein
MKRREHIIDHSSQLNALTVAPFLRPRGLGTVRLSGVMADDPRREAWERDINRNFYACGCDTGSRGLVIGVFVGGAVALIGFREAPWSVIAGIVAAGAITGAVIGKVIGLVQAQGRLRRVVDEIIEFARPKEPQRIEEGMRCG